MASVCVVCVFQNVFIAFGRSGKVTGIHTLEPFWSRMVFLDLTGNVGTELFCSSANWTLSSTSMGEGAMSGVVSVAGRSLSSGRFRALEIK